ncbi:MAG: hypothetical protein DRJ52_03510 [Thermoprotei archaeon]|nr:MAG: hypothetical protein DRJ52_03510 [Thermoprotei archaeon]RLE99824.1 MAG: hypothetical protein DRJ63_04115 [Thermoprotei archaeon]
MFRKAVHIFLAAFLTVPFIFDIKSIGLSLIKYYSTLLLVASVVNAIQIRRPPLVKVMFDHMKESREKIFNKILYEISSKKETRIYLLNLLKELEQTVVSQINTAIRDYERKVGYLGITFGAAGALLASIFFKNYVFYGVLALIVVDCTSALFGTIFGKNRLPYTNATLEGSIAGFLSFLIVLVSLRISLIYSLILSLIASIVEAYGVEDNLTVPIIVALFAKIFSLPLPPLASFS